MWYQDHERQKTPSAHGTPAFTRLPPIQRPATADKSKIPAKDQKSLCGFLPEAAYCLLRLSRFFDARVIAQRTSLVISGRWRSRCQKRTTIHPRLTKVRLTNRSRTTFRSIFLFQNSVFVFGSLQRGCPCQYSPSIKIANLIIGKAKSGLPNIRWCLRQPEMCAFRRISTNFNSVAFEPVLRIRDIISDRLAGVKVSTRPLFDVQGTPTRLPR
jgi:hypothetical protein